MELYLIRHGESTANVEERFSGWSPAPLTQKGREQAKRTGERIAGISFDRIFSSDQIRAKETTGLVFPGLPYTEDWRLREIHIGRMLEDRLRVDGFREYGQALHDAVDKRDFTPFGGESYAMHCERAAQFMEDLSAFSDDERIAVVCHGGTILAILSYVLGVEVKSTKVMVENASLTCFRRQNGAWKLIKWSDTGNVLCEGAAAAGSYAN